MHGLFLGYNHWGETVWEQHDRRWVMAFNGPLREKPDNPHPQRFLRRLDLKTAALAWTGWPQPDTFLAALPQPATDPRWAKPLWSAYVNHLQEGHLPENWSPLIPIPAEAPDPYLKQLGLAIHDPAVHAHIAWSGTDWHGNSIQLAEGLFTRWLLTTTATTTRQLWSAKQALSTQEYQALSQHKDSSSWIASTLAAPTRQALATWNAKHGSIDDWATTNLGPLVQHLSAEQVDAIALAWERLSTNQAFILGDITGKGKGRILASLAYLAKQNNLNVIFFTEKKHLFQDFYRDWKDLGLEDADFYLLHQEGRIKNAQNKTLFTGHARGVGAAPFIMTTYSQLSHSAQAKQKKDWLKKHLNGTYGKGILLLDEAHTAAGKSEIKKQITDLLNHSQGDIYSTATFAKELPQLSFYKGVVTLPKDMDMLLKQIKSHPDLQAAITAGLATQGAFLRREHAADYASQLWLQNLKPHEAEAVNHFVAAWNSLFALLQSFPRGTVEKHYWYYLGAWVSRSASELALYLKFNNLPQLLDAIKAKGAKPVLVMETTLEAGLRRWLEPDADSEDDEIDDAIVASDSDTAETQSDKTSTDVANGEASNDDDAAGKNTKTAPKKKKKRIPLPLCLDEPPLWRERLLWLGKKWWPTDLKDKKRQEVEGHYAALEQRVSCMPDWRMGVIDYAKDQLHAYYGKNKVGEISGRSLQVLQDETGWKIASYSNEERTKTVNKFNSGEYEVLLLTRPGAAGISLHAGEKFKDQRPRVLVEMEIPKNPIERLQFWGRVNRNDQVIASEIWSWVLDLPTERRRWEKQQQKYTSTQAHLGKQSTDSLGLLTTAGNDFVYAWLGQREEIRKWLGLQSRWEDPGETELLDKFLNRLLVLDLDTQKTLLDTLSKIADHEQDWVEENNWLATAPARRCRSTRWMGEGQKDIPNSSLQNHGLWLSEWIIPAPMAPTDLDWNAVRAEALTRQDDGLIQHEWPAEWNTYWKALTPGSVIKAERPLDHQKAPAFIVERSILSRDPDLPQTAYVKVWWSGMPKPIWVSLQRITADKHFEANTEWKAKWWELSGQGPLHIQVMEGNPLLLHWWGQITGMGRSMLWQPQGASKATWLLHQYGWDWWMQHAVPLWDFQIAMSFVQQNQAYALHSMDGKLSMQKVGISWMLQMPKRYYWEDMAFPLRQRVPRPKASGDLMVSTIESKDIGFVMWGLQFHQKIFWCIPRTREPWLDSYLSRLKDDY